MVVLAGAEGFNIPAVLDLEGNWRGRCAFIGVLNAAGSPAWLFKAVRLRKRQGI